MNAHVFFPALFAAIVVASASSPSSVDSLSPRNGAKARVRSTTTTYDYVTRSQKLAPKKPSSPTAWRGRKQATTTERQSPRGGAFHESSSPPSDQDLNNRMLLMAPRRQCTDGKITAANGECVDAFEMDR